MKKQARSCRGNTAVPAKTWHSALTLCFGLGKDRRSSKKEHQCEDDRRFVGQENTMNGSVPNLILRTDISAFVSEGSALPFIEDTKQRIRSQDEIGPCFRAGTANHLTVTLIPHSIPKRH